MRKIISDAKDYFYERDPNFDFDNRNVEETLNRNHLYKSKHKIQRYYEDQAGSKDTRNKIRDNYKSEKNIGSPYFEGIDSINKRRSDNVDARRPKRLISNYNLTKVEDDAIGPAKMRPRPKYKLKQVCEANDYDLSRDDFEDNKILLGNGTFGEVYLVC